LANVEHVAGNGCRIGAHAGIPVQFNGQTAGRTTTMLTYITQLPEVSDPLLNRLERLRSQHAIIELLWHIGEHFVTRASDQDVVLDSHAAPTGHINAWLDRYD